ncbi:MAG: hypothetical protein WD021_01325 [Rhodothermales bacterium]
MSANKKFQAEVVSTDEAHANLSELRSRSGSRYSSKFDPLKQHIQWLERGMALKIDEMERSDVANLRSYIDRNVQPVGKGLTYVVRSSRIREDGSKYRVFVFLTKKE